MERFQDENKILWSFSSEILVKCPKCESKASILKKPAEDCKCGKCKVTSFECKHCFTKPRQPIIKYVAYGKRYCINCRKSYEFESQAFKKKSLIYKTRCPHCNFQEEGKTKIKEIIEESKFEKGLMRERWYNLPLWFQKEFDNEIFWAYNLDHIYYLERYINAGLRERNSKVNYTSSLVARLPKFVKAAKNREKLLKILKKWKE
ncbi:hypothetical protein [Flavobacterium sp. H4147]|uniref:hypothetical protein n=1 Tax=Flavobacterium sp. H4147 TaxID=3034149 RepID=UPI0023EC3673|nr:hypothetical protein [Flavobacterium sp. H4147]